MGHTITVKGVRWDASGNILVDVAMPSAVTTGHGEPIDLPVVVGVDALADRCIGYGLDHEEKALAAILKEHVTRLNGTLDEANPHPDPRIHTYGGLRTDVEIVGDLTIPARGQ